jgi:hypothetical protein
MISYYNVFSPCFSSQYQQVAISQFNPVNFYCVLAIKKISSSLLHNVCALRISSEYEVDSAMCNKLYLTSYKFLGISLA